MSDDRRERKEASRALAVAGLAGFAVALGVSFTQGPPAEVPAAALGWPVLLYLERAALVALVIMGVGGIIDRMSRGDQVQAFGGPGANLEVAEQAADSDKELRDAFDAAVTEIDARLARLEKPEE